MLENWRECKLGDVIDIKHGYAFKGDNITTNPTSDILVTPGNFNIGGGFKSSKFKYYNGDYPQDYVFNQGDIIVSMTDLSKEGDTLGYSAKIPKCNNYKYLHNQRIGLVKVASNNVDKDFIYWLMRTYEYQAFIVCAATGTSIRHTSPKLIKEYKFELPPLQEQKAIAEILSSLDDKIDLLHRQNHTLESIAQTLFRQWFIEEANPEWEEKPLSFFGDIICGKTPSKSNEQYFGGNTPFIKIPDMHNNTFVLKTTDTLSEVGAESQKNRTLPPKSICVSCIATVGLVSMNVVESQTNQQINSIIPKKDFYKYFLYLFMQSSYELLHSMASGGTATLNLNTRNFSEMEILKPNDETLKNFHQIIESTFDKILFNQKQIQTLENLRDTLLPKLISGELRIKI